MTENREQITIVKVKRLSVISRVIRMKRFAMWGILSVIMFSIISCQNVFFQDEWKTFKGTIIYNDFEGGFYGIITEDGKKLDPINLDKKFKSDGLILRGQFKELKEQTSTHQWGVIVEIKEATKIGS